MADNAVDIDLHHRIGFGRKTSLPKRHIIVHTTENSLGTKSSDIIDYQVRTRTGSYHRLVDATGKITLANTDDWQVWAVGNKGNDIALHVSVVWQAKTRRAEWLAQPQILEGVARVIAHWSRLYDIPLVKLSRAELGAMKPGVAGHLEAQVWGNTNHWDPGYHFPYDVVLKRAAELKTPPSNPEPSKETPVDKSQADRIERKLDLLLDQMVGYPNRDFPGWDQLGDRTLTDGVAAIGEKLGIAGMKDTSTREDAMNGAGSTNEVAK